MISALLRLALLLALVRWAEQTWPPPTLWLADAIANGFAMFGGSSFPLMVVIVASSALTVRLLSLPLWLAPVPLDRRIGPKRSPFSRRPLRVHLRFRASRFFMVTLFEMWLVSALWTVLQKYLERPPLPSWIQEPASMAGFGDWRDVLIALVVVHVIAAGALWFAQRLAERLLAASTRPTDFVAFQLENASVRRFTAYQVVGVHLSACAAFSWAVDAQLALTVAAVSLPALGLVALLAACVTIAWERWRDRWLAGVRAKAMHDVHAAQLVHRTIAFLHPHRITAYEAVPHPVAAVPPMASPAALEGAENIQDVSVAPETVGTGAELAGNGATEVAQAIDPADLALDLPDNDAEEFMPRERDFPKQSEEEERGFPWRLAFLGLGAAFFALATVVGWQWLQLPTAEETRQLARSAHVHVRKAGSGADVRLTLIGNRYDYSLNTSLENVSEHFLNAVVASEDHRFFSHGPGYMVAKFVQAGALCAARKLNVFASSAGCAGNSTITQQLARNLFLSESRSIVRKLTELLWAIKMELGLSKQEILEFYVNRLYLGRGNYGVELGARDYFRKSASELGIFDAALLAAAIKRPGWNIRQDIEAARARAALIVALMRRHGYVKKGVRFPSGYTPRRGQRGPSRPYLGHLWQWIRPTALEALTDLPDGDYKILTTLNAEVEIYAERHLEAQVRALQRAGIPASQGAVVVMRPDGRVLAMVGGVGDDVEARGFNRAKRTRGLLPRPPASAFKPFVYLTALEAGVDPDDLIDARPVSIRVPGDPRPYRPLNHDGRSYGYISLREGLVKSVNTAAVRLLHDRLGFEALFEVLGRLGIKTGDFRQQWGIALGSQGVPLMEMTTAYATFANGGTTVQPSGFVAITTDSGKVVWRAPAPSRRRAFDPEDIEKLSGMLTGVVANGTGAQARAGLPREQPVAGKTGTGDSFVDAWFIGFTDNLVIGVWIGNDRPRTMPGVYGGTAPARTFNRLLRDVLTHTEVGK